jgi:hypothetical protein
MRLDDRDPLSFAAKLAGQAEDLLRWSSACLRSP